jgi:Na+/phosphate symporter
MTNFKVLLSIASAIVLFLYGLGAFSYEIQSVGGETLKKWLGRLTARRWLALILGAVANLCFNAFGVVLFLPFLEPATRVVTRGSPTPRVTLWIEE